MTANVDFAIRLGMINPLALVADETTLKQSIKYRSVGFSSNAISCRWDLQSLSHQNQQRQGIKCNLSLQTELFSGFRTKKENRKMYQFSVDTIWLLWVEDKFAHRTCCRLNPQSTIYKMNK